MRSGNTTVIMPSNIPARNDYFVVREWQTSLFNRVKSLIFGLAASIRRLGK